MEFEQVLHSSWSLKVLSSAVSKQLLKKMENLAFELINGKKHNSVLLYLVEEKQLFKIKSKTIQKTYYVCYQKKCFARVELFADGTCRKPKNNTAVHNHGIQEDLRNEIKCIDGLRQDCLSGAGVLSDVNAISGIRKAFKRSLEK